MEPVPPVFMTRIPFCRKNCVKSVKASALPVGIIPGAEADVVSCGLEEGDTIIMLTDGVESRDEGNKWIKEFIERFEDEDENRLAKAILERAVEVNGGKVIDDMTVLCARIHGRGLRAKKDVA